MITIFLELICYNRKIEYLETILFSVAFLFFIVVLGINLLFGNRDLDDSISANLILFSMILLGVTTAFNTFAERQVKVPKIIKYLLYCSSAILIVLVLLKALNYCDFYTNNLVFAFLAISVVGSMLLIRRTKPEKRIQHREKIERIMSLAFLVFVPIAIFVEFVAPQISAFSFSKNQISITPPIIFIFLALSKLFDDLNRLSLFTSDNKVEAQNAKNYNLTPRETEIADLLIKGHSYAKISELLFIAMPTVKSHVSNIYKKVHVKNKIELLNALKS